MAGVETREPPPFGRLVGDFCRTDQPRRDQKYGKATFRERLSDALRRLYGCDSNSCTNPRGPLRASL